MDKYSKAFLLLFRIPIGIFCILLGFALLGISCWVSTFSEVASIILLIGLLGGGFLINHGIGYAFLGDQFRVSNYVHDGNSTFEVVKTPKLLKRRKLVTLIGFVAYILLAIYYIVRTIVCASLIGYFCWELLIFAAVALLFAFGVFLIYKKTKHIDLGEKSPFKKAKD